MSKCVYCNKEIDIEWDKDFDFFGMDGDVIHKKCVKDNSRKMDAMLYMTEEEFEKHILNK